MIVFGLMLHPILSEAIKVIAARSIKLNLVLERFYYFIDITHVTHVDYSGRLY